MSVSIIERQLFLRIFGPAHLEPAATQVTYTSREDIEVLLALSQTFRPKIVIEIGIQRGVTSKILLTQAPWIEKYVGIDITPDARPTLEGQYDEVPLKAGELVSSDPRVEVVVRPNGSRDLRVTDLPVADLMFIDGDHSETCVLHDTWLARQVVRAGGIICWHDYNNVTDVTKVIDDFNIREGDHICSVTGTWVCFEFRRDDGRAEGRA